MRIIGGEWKGRKLAELGDGDALAHLRPTSDRAREALFNMLSHPRYGGAPIGANVLDLFAGTGALGLEALSRGAASVRFVENGQTSLKLLRQNIKTLNASAEIITQDATNITIKDAQFNLVFLDPPYEKGLGELAIEALLKGDYLAHNALIIWEDARAPRPPKSFFLMDQRKMGKAVISIFKHEER